VQAAFGDHELRLFGDDRRDTQCLVEQGGAQWDLARPADEIEAGDAAGVDVRVAQQLLGQRGGRPQHRPGEPFELLPPQQDLGAESGDRDDGAAGARQHLLRGAYLVPQLPPGRRVRPQLTVSGLEKGHDRGVDVQAADVVEPAREYDVETVWLAAQHRDVAGAGAEVVDDDGRTGPDSGPEAGEVRRRRDRLAD
jgi:hypothetical protein